MFERSALEKQILTQNQPEVSRRSFLQAGGLAVAAAATPNSIRWLAEHAGEVYDTIASPEDVISQPIAILEPREDNTPTVEPQPHAVSVGIRTSYVRRGDTTALHLATDTSLRAEHTHTPIENADMFTSAGVAVITTAEGLAVGEQAYCKLFKGEKQIVAIGYEGGLYVYEPALGQTRQGTTGEWVRVVTQKDGSALPSPVNTTTSWKELETATSREMLIQEVVAGTNTLRDLGYRPFGSVLPSTRMPDMQHYTFTPEACAQDADEVIAGEKPYFITSTGEVIDLGHLKAKASETLSLFTQLQYQYISKEAQPTASVAYSEGSPAAYEFSVHPDSLDPSILPDTTFAVMNAVTTLMEGVSQRYANEKIPLADAFSRRSGLTPEDMFSNTLGITGMLSLIHEQGLADKLAEPLQAIHRKNPDIPAQDMQAAIERVIADIKPLLVKVVLAQIARTHGVRTLEAPITCELPKGLYPLIPTKLNDKDSTNSARIDLQAAGVTTNNPRVRYKPTNVPAMQATIGHLLTRAKL